MSFQGCIGCYKYILYNIVYRIGKWTGESDNLWVVKLAVYLFVIVLFILYASLILPMLFSLHRFSSNIHR
jgi:hypothetical protein